ncbi:glycosyltransferase family 4 protein [Oleidesulfovibrio sp.]|uniref:glycosyltransferase family 4 protein n=1 Tax=Oleidesulfovibrio sp. TaxID=2909707 RepID=UPI003A89D9A2
MPGRKQLLTVVRWPVGGIRTYMRYVYGHMSDAWRVTILAVDTQESEALKHDAQAMGAELIFCGHGCHHAKGHLPLLQATWKLLAQRRFDLVQSQGFTAATMVGAANMFFRVPHVLTVHGVLEERLLTGWKGQIKRTIANRTILGADMVYGVGRDILEHLHEQVPGFDPDGPKATVIPNGIETSLYTVTDAVKGAFRKKAGLATGQFVFGSLGRFMQQKGLDCLIEAVATLDAMRGGADAYSVVAVGSGDYQHMYQELANQKGVAHRFVFMPFQADAAEIYCDLDAVVMPSRWEAWALVPMEAMCSGVPLIASDCMGLREATADTPSLQFPTNDVEALANAMAALLDDDGSIRKSFSDFRPEAVRRFDVQQTARCVEELFDGMLKG